MMIENCLIANTHVRILTHATMIRRRTRIAHALLEYRISAITLGTSASMLDTPDKTLVVGFPPYICAQLTLVLSFW